MRDGPRRSSPAGLGLFFALALPAGSQEQAPDREGIEFFERRVRPVLVERCYACHSAGAEKVKGGLLVDTRAGLLKGGSEGPAVVPGDPDRSRLILAVRYADADLRMPPKGRLTPEQVGHFEEWVRRGAPVPADVAPERAAPAHWAFRPPKEPPVPEVKAGSWPKTPVDRFILAKLEGKGLRPAPPADKRTLIRRATFDLIGLPPTPEECEAFLEDSAPEAFARVIDRLLASPHYGERWGRHWLDLARYSDTKGYVQVPEDRRYVHSSAYRDWVIRAFNEDLPFDRFLIRQIAADQEEGGEAGSLAALGFLTVGRRFKNMIHDIIDDRIDTVTRATMGLTVGCARCHDHKFDPIPTRDYYSLYGVFAGAVERPIPLGDQAPSTPERAAFEGELKKRMDAFQEAFRSIRRRLIDRHQEKTAEYLAAVADGERLPPEDAFTVLNPEELNPTVTRRWQAYLSRRASESDPVFAPWHAFSRIPRGDWAALAYPTMVRLNAVRLNPRVAEALSGELPGSMREVAERYGALLASAGKPSPSPDPADEELRRVLTGEDSPVNVPSGGVHESEYFLDSPSRDELMKLQSRIDRWILESKGAPPYAVTLEEPAGRPQARIFRRGNPADKGEEVPCRFLECLSGDPRAPFHPGRTRLELASSIASRENPLTARVLVNRLWLHHFGEGLMRTPSDFGLRSDPPTHPELLDWLALRFMEDGGGGSWSIKKMHRLLMLSSVYGQGCEGDPQGRRVDPSNLLCGRMNRRRLDFEELRDSLLAVSGELDPALGGRPEDLTSRPASRRRSVYGLVDRLNLPSLFRVFDFPSPDAHSPRRVTTTTAPQALFLMNSPFAQEQARRLARRPDVLAERDPEGRVRRLYRLLFGRPPAPEELALGVEFVRTQPAAPAIADPGPWRYGFGEFDSARKRMKAFEPLPTFTGNIWHAGPPNLLISLSAQQPDVKNGWPSLSADGGHPGGDRRSSAVRRWIAPQAGRIEIEGKLPGPHAWIVSGRTGALAGGKDGAAKVSGAEVQAEETIDFIVDGRGASTEDAFLWAPRIRMTEASGRTRTWDAARDFRGPAAVPLGPWERYAQVLLETNEFAFVD